MQNMADCCVTQKSTSPQRSYNPEDNSDHSCLNCAELESLLDKTRKESSLSQLIVKLLHKEINDNTAEMTPKPTTTIPEYEAGDNVASSNTWSRVASKRLHNKNKARISNTYQVTRPIGSANRYTKLANLPDTTNCCEGYATPKIIRVT